MSSPLLVDLLAYWNLNDNGSGGVSLLDATGNGNNLGTNNGVTLGTGIIAGDGVFNGSSYIDNTANVINFSGDYSISLWVNYSDLNRINTLISNTITYGSPILYLYNGSYYWAGQGLGEIADITDPINTTGVWTNVVITNQSQTVQFYINGNAISTNQPGWYDVSNNISLGLDYNLGDYLLGQLDEIGIWSRALTPTEITSLYNNGAGITYPFNPAIQNLYYNDAQEDGDWGNLLNWWQDSGFTYQATALPTATNPVNLYNQVTQNTQGADQCFCASASFWSADFGAGLTLQATGVVNMQGSSIMAGTTTDGVSMHDSSQLSVTSVVDGNVTMRDSSRAFGSILGNATIYYDGGNGQFPIGGTVAGSVTYLGWPAVSPQWFNDKATGGANDGDFNNQANWWTDNTYTTRPINSVGTQAIPDASTDVFIAPNTGIFANTGNVNPTINSITATSAYLSNITITVSNGVLFNGSGNYGTTNSTIYGNVTFADTAYNDHAVIQGTATYKSASSLQQSWTYNSLGNTNQGASYGSTGFVVNISGGGGGTSLGTNWISRLLHLPWFIKV